MRWGVTYWTAVKWHTIYTKIYREEIDLERWMCILQIVWKRIKNKFEIRFCVFQIFINRTGSDTESKLVFLAINKKLAWLNTTRYSIMCCWLLIKHTIAIEAMTFCINVLQSRARHSISSKFQQSLLSSSDEDMLLHVENSRYVNFHNCAESQFKNIMTLLSCKFYGVPTTSMSKIIYPG